MPISLKALVIAFVSTLFAAVVAAIPVASKAAPEPPSISSTLSAVPEISRELKRIDERLVMLERSLAGVDASLKPVGALAQPAMLQVTLTQAADVFYTRARDLILLATLCGAALLILHALLRRWNREHPFAPTAKQPPV